MKVSSGLFLLPGRTSDSARHTVVMPKSDAKCYIYEFIAVCKVALNCETFYRLLVCANTYVIVSSN